MVEEIFFLILEDLSILQNTVRHSVVRFRTHVAHVSIEILIEERQLRLEKNDLL